ncbi:unnamed protein product [Onchocerca flexuosa]|uniref:Transposase n=1 Tax=Onchocerca flexuosa TaxID=387005 RepID=A0A183HN06_9BILA|nr:unnamed protein product [Onchocerca flexuosa]
MQTILDQLLQRVKSLVKVGSLFEYAAAAILNYRINTICLPKSLCLMMQQAVENCKCNSGKNYKFYPASIVTARYFIDDARSLAFTTISKGHNYRIILQDMEMT